MKLILQTANIVGDEKNCLYPNRAEVTSAEELQEAVKMDHVCAEYDNDYRSKENFRQSNVLVMDCDNDHTENPAEWITPEKLDEMMPDISYAIAFSRHHMLEKNGKAPRPKFHVYFEIEPTQDADYYAALKEAIYRKYTFFDDNALDAARFIFGADVGDAIWHEGWLTIDSEVEIGAPIERNDTGRVGNVIIAGTRNKTMSKFAGRVIIRYGNTDKAHQIFMDEAAKCEPPLDDEELATIWASAVRWYEKKISKQDGYVPPDQYNAQEFMSLKPGDYSDIGEAKVLAREYGDELRFTDSTDLIRYNGIYWQESKQMAIGAMMEFLDLQLQDAKDQVAATKQALLDSGVSQEDVTAGGKTLSKAVSGDDQLKLLMAYMSALQYYAFVMKHRDYKYVMSSLNQAKPLVLMDINQLDVNPYLLNTPEATYDLRQGLDGAQEHDPLDYLTKCTNASPGDAGKDLWLDTVSRVFCNDPELIDYVQTIVGMAVVGKVFSEALIISYGDGANGKSTFWNTLARVLGNYSGMMSADALTVGCKRNVKPEMAELKGKRLIIAAELEEGMRLNTSTVKQLCSTDEIEAEKKYKDPFKYVPTHTMVLYTNHLPKVGASDDGTWRRLIVIPFGAKIQGKTDIKTIPDMNRIIQLSELFGVSTDYLLKDNLEQAEPTQGNDEVNSSRTVSMEEANAFLATKEENSRRVALAVMLCILSPVALILLGGAQAFGLLDWPEEVAGGIGLIVLILMIIPAVALFIISNIRISRYEYLEKEPVDTLYGVTGMVRDRKERFQPVHTQYLLIGILICIASVIPLFISMFFGKESFWGVVGIASILIMAAIGVLLIVRVSIIWGSYQMLLEEEDYSREEKESSRRYGYICSAYWCLITAAYLAWSFIGNNWQTSWVIWPIAGVAFGAVIGITKALKKR